MKEIVTIESKILAVSFSHFGSIYFANDIVEGAVPALLTNGAPSELKERVYQKFSIGPTVAETFGRRNARRCRSRGILLLEKYLKVAPAMMDIDPILTRPTLWHGDLHSSNLFVDDGHTTATIDWQGFILLQRPDNFDDLGPEQQAEIKQQIFKSTLYQLYLLETKERNPLLAKAFHLDHGKTRRLPVELAGNTWNNGIVSFRQALINVERYWQELGIHGECPYHFTQDELHIHAEGWNEVQDFFNSIEGLVKRDGWTNPDKFDAAFNFFSELRERGLTLMKGEEKRAFNRQTRWARK
ncbi:hypothetical protein N7508_009490 [Penicillium antarcticum]|nr:uncharacterized protein N7508_009490 [Penicillium antarcticum]KAJ5294669.1 hypothetical protein N7508_009490 [Penicillium antarcticum]